MRRWIVALLLMIGMGALIAWRLHIKESDAQAQTQQRHARITAAPEVAVASAEVRDVVSTYEGTGSVESPNNVKISAKITGEILYLQLHEGDRVTQGQLLIRLDPGDVNSQVQGAQAALAEAKSRLAQAEITQNPTDVGVKTTIREQDAALTSSRADDKQTRQNYAAQKAAALAAVTDAQGRVDNAQAAIGSAQAAIGSAKANLDNATAKFNRTNDLYKQGYIAAQDVDDARTAVSVAQGALDVAKQQLNAAQAQRNSALAQKESAQRQADIVANSGQANIEAADAKVNQMNAALEAAQSNKAMTPAYQQNLAALRSSVTAAQAALEGAKRRLGFTELFSPLTGYVTGRYMDPGTMATPGIPILGLQAIQQVWVNIPVPEEVSRKIFYGQSATVTLDALPGHTFVGKVVQINPSADASSRQFTIRVLLDNNQSLLKSGMFARITLVTDKLKGAVVVPREAVQKGPQGPFVVVIDSGNKAHVTPVSTGADDANGFAITQGVHPGDRVVVLTGLALKDGQAVQFRENGKTAGSTAGASSTTGEHTMGSASK